jgi:hypothetical protein
MEEETVKATRVQMYLKDEEVIADLKEVVKLTGWSASDVASYSFIVGFYEIRESLLKNTFNHKARIAGAKRRNVKRK